MSDEQKPGADPVVPDTKDIPKQFDAAYVEELRRENAKYRTAAKSEKERADKIQADILAEQGKFKELYEGSTAKLKEAEGLTARLAEYQAEDERQLEAAKKALSVDSIALIDGLPSLTTRERLKLAQQLAGKKQAQSLPVESRPGAGDSPSIESVVEAYKKGNTLERAKLLGAYKNTNAQLYERLLTL
jgi:hypothetical protein